MRPQRKLKRFDLYSVRDAADYLEVSIGTVHDYARAGLLKSVRASNASWLFTREALDDFKKTNDKRKAEMSRLSIAALARSRRAS